MLKTNLLILFFLNIRTDTFDKIISRARATHINLQKEIACLKCIKKIRMALFQSIN